VSFGVELVEVHWILNNKYICLVSGTKFVVVNKIIVVKTVEILWVEKR